MSLVWAGSISLDSTFKVTSSPAMFLLSLSFGFRLMVTSIFQETWHYSCPPLLATSGKHWSFKRLPHQLCLSPLAIDTKYLVQRRWTWTGDFKCREVKTGFCRKRWTQTGSSGTLIGWKSGQTTFIPLWDRMEGAWLWTLYCMCLSPHSSTESTIYELKETKSRLWLWTSWQHVDTGIFL